MKDGVLLIILAFIFLFKCWMDWSEMREDLRDMMEDEEEKQREDDCAGAAAEDKGCDVQ